MFLKSPKTASSYVKINRPTVYALGPEKQTMSTNTRSHYVKWIKKRFLTLSHYPDGTKVNGLYSVPRHIQAFVFWQTNQPAYFYSCSWQGWRHNLLTGQTVRFFFFFFFFEYSSNRALKELFSLDTMTSAMTDINRVFSSKHPIITGQRKPWTCIREQYCRPQQITLCIVHPFGSTPLNLDVSLSLPIYGSSVWEHCSLKISLGVVFWEIGEKTTTVTTVLYPYWCRCIE